MSRLFYKELDRVDDYYYESLRKCNKQAQKWIIGAVIGLGIMLWSGASKINPQLNPYWDSTGMKELRTLDDSQRKLVDLEQYLSLPLLTNLSVAHQFIENFAEIERVRSGFRVEVKQAMQTSYEKRKAALDNDDVSLFNQYNLDPLRKSVFYTATLLTFGLLIGGYITHSRGQQRCTREYLKARRELELKFDNI